MSDKKLFLDKVEIVAFDWDSTLACSREVLVFSVNQVLEKYGLPCWDIVKDLRDRNLSFRDNFPRIFGEKAEVAYEEYRKIYKKSVAQLIKAPNMALETLELLRSKGIKIVIVSNKDRMLFDFEVEMLYNRKWFDFVACGHEAERDKPFPEQIWYAIKPFDVPVSPESVWMVGDSPMDSRAALAAGVKAVRIGEPIWGSDTDDNESKNILFVADFKELYTLLTE